MANVLPTRRLGRDGPEIPVLGLGVMGLSTFYGATPSDEERLKFLDRAYELSCTHWDSAALYGDSEELLGKWFERTGKRSEIFLATKFGANITPEGITMNNEPEFIRESVNQSLKRLKTDYIDLLYCHRFTGKVPVEEIVKTMKEFVDSGKVRYLGLSEGGVDTVQRASKVHPIAAFQIEYNPFSLDIEKPEVGLLKTCRELGIATVAYSPLGRGMLTGQYKSMDDFEENDFRRRLPRFSKENFVKNLELVDTLKALADKKGCTTAQLTLAWLIQEGDDIFPIPGTKKIKYLEENVGACKVHLTPDESLQIRQAVEKAEVQGSRGTIPADTPPLQ